MTRRNFILDKMAGLLAELVILALIFAGVLVVMAIVNTVVGAVTGWKVTALILLIVVYFLMDSV